MSAVRANVREAIVVVDEGVVGLKPNRLDPIGPGPGTARITCGIEYIRKRHMDSVQTSTCCELALLEIAFYRT